MESEILKPKVEANGYLELLAIGLVKTFEEKLTAPYIGNGTIVSGAVKGIAGGVAHHFIGKNTAGRIVAGAFGVDAGEDLAVGLMSLLNVGGAQSGGNARSDMTNAMNW